jgi:anti-sigma factor RsiW
MCPDRQLLSVYLDGELPSPWKEKMENHLAGCEECSSLLEQFRACSGILHEDSAARAGGLEQLAMLAAKDRALKNLSPHLVRPITRPSVWRRTVSLPLPAAAAAAAIFVFAFVFAIMRPIGAVNAPEEQLPTMASADSTINLDNVIPASDLIGVMQYLGKQDNSDYMIINLPEAGNFTSAGEPLIIKAADYSRRVGAR